MKKIFLTKEAQDIFGDIVEYAYYFDAKDKSHMPGFRGDSENIFALEPHDAHSIFIKLKNGKSFSLWSSEWGGLLGIDEKTFVKDANWE